MNQFSEHPKFLEMKQALKKTFGNEIPDAIHPLNGGGSSSLMFQIRYNKQYYVLRLIGLDQPIEDKQVQIECAHYAARFSSGIISVNKQDVAEII